MLGVALLGLVIGVPLGYAMQRTNLCFNSAYREALLRRNTVLLRAILLAILIQMVGVALFVQLGIGGISLSVVPFFWLATIIGGFFFGIAMVYAIRMTTSGLVMGLSATLAGGCNIGHGFSGLPTLALSSLTATLFTFLGAWLGNYLRFVRPKRSRADG